MSALHHTEPSERAELPRVSAFNVLWPLLLGLATLGVIAWLTYEPDAFGRMVQSINPWLMAAAVGTLLVRVVTGGWRLSFVSRHRLGFMAGLRGQLAWDFSSNVTPSVVGGAPLTAYYLARETRYSDQVPVRLGEASALMTYVMLLDQVWFALSVPVVLVAATMMEVIPANVGTVGTWTIMGYFVLLMTWTGVFAYGTLFRPELVGRLVDRIFRLPFLRRFQDRAASESEEFVRRATRLRSQPLDFFARGLLLTAATWIARYALVVFVIWSFVPDVDRLLLFIRSIAMTMGSLVMPTPGGAGGIEGLYALFFAPMLPDNALLAPSLLIWRILGYYIFLVFGITLSGRHIQKTVLKNTPAADE